METSQVGFVENAVIEAANGVFSLEELRQSGGSLKAMGVTSVQYMTLLDYLESRLGIVIEPDVDPEVFEHVESISTYLESQVRGR